MMLASQDCERTAWLLLRTPGDAPEPSSSWHRQQGDSGRSAGEAPVEQQQHLKVLPQQRSRLLQHGGRLWRLSGGGGRQEWLWWLGR